LFEFIQKDIDKNKGTVYTPSHLVNLLIDECLPISINEQDLNVNVRLADVSCGSGIFITTAFKRLVQRLRIKKWVEKGKPNYLPNPTLKEVKNILNKNIFGVDLHPTAVKLTKFSLQLALCQLVPKDELWTWNEEKVFKDLENENIFHKDFFDFLTEKEYRRFHNSFDLIIGNPPFFPLSDKKEKPEYSTITKKLKKEIDFEFSVKIPDNQLALMFLEASSILLKHNADLCFIQKSTAFLFNKGVKNFRDSLFNQFHVHQIIDFTLLKKHLYKSKSKPLLDDYGNYPDLKTKLRKIDCCCV
jgi:type I restriction-modification system DNA methylase subunit